jgi:hypothetical protein
MDITDDMSFDEWFDIFQDRMRKHQGYTGSIDKYSFESEYEIELKTPEAAADDWHKELSE